MRARWAAVALATAALVPARLPAATTTRTEDQRLTDTNGVPEPAARFGTTVGMAANAWASGVALVGAPLAGTLDSGSLHRFRWNGSAWVWNLEKHPSGTGSAPPFPMDSDGSSVVTAIPTPAGPTMIEWHGAAGTATFQVSYSSEIEAIAYRFPVLALGLPDANGEHGLIVIYRLDMIAGWQYVSDLVGAAPGDRLGASLALNDTVLVAGAPGFGANGAAYLFVCCDGFGEWVEWQRLDSPAVSQTAARFGAAVDITSDGDWIAVGSPFVDRVTSPGARVDVGGVYLYEHVGLQWELDTLLRPVGAGNGDFFGTSVAMHGKILAAGSPGEDGAAVNEGAAYVYHLAGGEWETVPRLRLVDSLAAKDNELGKSLTAGDVGILVGMPGSDGNGATDSGAVLFYRDAGAFFADGFESGNTSAWSLSSP